MTRKQDKSTKPAAENQESVPKANRFEDQITQLEQDVESAEKKAADNWDKALRAVAELENTKRRAEKDVSNAHKYALERFAQDLLPVIDSMEKGLEVKSDHQDMKVMQEGMAMTMRMFVDAVKKYGLEQIDPIGEPFDPNHHEALSMVPNPDMESNTVMTVVQRGYLLNGRLIRPARVVVVAAT